MSVVLHVLFYAAIVGTVTSTIYCGMVLAAAVRFGLRKRREDRAPADFLPPVSLLKPLHGSEDGLERNIETFFEQKYPAPFELLFCARHETDEGLKLARRVGARYPHVDARYLTCGEPMPKFHNAKVYSLEKLDAEAKNDLFITSDADVRVEPDYILRLIQNLRDPHMGLASCLYIGTLDHPAKAGLSAHLDAVGKSVEMSSGVLVADMLEGTKFALGATQVLPRKSFQAVGGFAELGQFYADDFVLGNRLAEQGTGVRMASHVIRLMVQDTPFWLSFRNQLRWMQSTRRSRPWGHLGSGLTFAMPFGILGLIWGLLSGHALLGVVWLLAMVVNRWLQAGAILTVLGDSGWLHGTLLYPLRDLLGSILWLGSYGGDNFYYRGKIYKLKDGGRVEAPE
ncbi:ceramide glucosyltransferase [Granulicella pectinivorans]|jgi:ceramide glucosyltransferase|uniref:Ceramide glucosyltransferase n=1 Tax=Granulicella pectinivorans TaxID=474950 RepID=A0A1I6N0H8_9BACT|nr:glycosyltransferase [Granulicella pectinivorans]SFS21424.1 ceramide glucosyltransferase [Granulicella pectinivorans]